MQTLVSPPNASFGTMKPHKVVTDVKRHLRCCSGKDLVSLSLREHTQRRREDKCEEQDHNNPGRISLVDSEEDDDRHHQQGYSKHGDKEPYEGVDTSFRVEVDKLVISAGSLFRG